MNRVVARLSPRFFLFPGFFAKPLVVVFSLAASVFVSRAAVVSASDDAKCTLATKGDSPTAKACAKGGRAEAKKVMKEMVKNAKGKGVKFTCDGCHKDLDNYELTKNATEDYKKLEAASGIK
jgi:hypothetical protein